MEQPSGGGGNAWATDDSGGADSAAEATSVPGAGGGVPDGSAGFGGDADAGEAEADTGPYGADAFPDEPDAFSDEADTGPDGADAPSDEVEQDADSAVDTGSGCPNSQVSCGGLCFHLSSDPHHCGACDVECPPGAGCISGTCTCPEEGQIVCSNVCVDPLSDSHHCGSCAVQCPSQQLCELGSCECPWDRTWCFDSCVDLQEDESHCGACGAACTGNFSCKNGICACPLPAVSCDGQCSDTLVDLANCGGCGQLCTTECTNGVCKPTCGDAIKNSLETAVDCGGPDCPGCSQGKTCSVDEDCACGKCDSGICGACATLVIKPGGASSPSTGGWYYSVAVADLNVDGVADLVASNPFTGLDIQMLVGNSLWVTDESALPHLTHHVLYDMNLDGKLDVVGATAKPVGFDVRRGSGFIYFYDHVTTPLSVASRAVAAGVFDEGEVPDVVVAHDENDTVSVWYGAGDGTFSSGPVLGSGAGPVHVIAPDLNGDGKTEVVSADSGSGGISVWFSNGVGFSPRTEIATGQGPAWVAAGDLNADGKLDLVVVNKVEATVSILLNSGSSFAAAPTLMAGGDPRAVAIDDFDRDGKLDLVVVGWPDRALIYRGTGAGAFDSPLVVTCTGGPQSVATGDLDGDGLPDIVVGGSSKIEVLANWSY